MADCPLIFIENKIPFIAGRLEQFANVVYLPADEFTPDNVADADALVVRTRTKCDASLLEKSTVKLIVTATIGTDHIDTQWCRNNGITVCNAAGCNAPGVAQYVWSSILNLGINPPTATIGIVGCGHVGSIVEEWANLLGAKTLICDPPLAEIGSPKSFVTLEQLLPQCDVVTLHTPLTFTGKHSTYHLINAARLEMMQKNAVLINAARGSVISTADVLKAAENGSIRLVIDCWENEPYISLPLLNISKIATPHIAGYSLQGKQRATRMAIETIARHFNFPLSEIELTDLASPYEKKSKLTAKEITDSYSPIADTDDLRNAHIGNSTSINEKAQSFEHLRNAYNYRCEP